MEPNTLTELAHEFVESVQAMARKHDPAREDLIALVQFFQEPESWDAAKRLF